MKAQLTQNEIILAFMKKSTEARKAYLVLPAALLGTGTKEEKEFDRWVTAIDCLNEILQDNESIIAHERRYVQFMERNK